jgi:hypothetical protein
MPRPKIDRFFILEIERLMLDEGMAHKPRKILDYFEHKLMNEGNKKYLDYPARRTIRKYMDIIRK